MPPSIPAASSVPPSGDVVTTPDDIQPGLPPRTLLVLLTRLLESLERLRAALATAKVLKRLRGYLYTDWQDYRLGQGLDGNAQGLMTKKVKTKTIEVAMDEHGYLIVDNVVAASPVAESFEENDDGDVESAEEEEPHLIRLTLHARDLCWEKDLTWACCVVWTVIQLIHERRSVVRAFIDEGADVKDPCWHP
ncbi:hypothetical protein PISMIDRAFT_14773 [Pisolithus microcarpus 441]|uniref:Uncharacterized protein n=1 Tax=Pisolithus microcarpus 441 TaxID=765257 RepID=A0A0C9ZD69_9AGAM|nr:hypothetical protein PISMIDRAFT_14773 [Pisolithus microcarpus 441]